MSSFMQQTFTEHLLDFRHADGWWYKDAPSLVGETGKLMIKELCDKESQGYA